MIIILLLRFQHLQARAGGSNKCILYLALYCKPAQKQVVVGILMHVGCSLSVPLFVTVLQEDTDLLHCTIDRPASENDRVVELSWEGLNLTPGTILS